MPASPKLTTFARARQGSFRVHALRKQAKSVRHQPRFFHRPARCACQAYPARSSPKLRAEFPRLQNRPSKDRHQRSQPDAKTRKQKSKNYARNVAYHQLCARKRRKAVGVPIPLNVVKGRKFLRQLLHQFRFGHKALRVRAQNHAETCLRSIFGIMAPVRVNNPLRPQVGATMTVPSSGGAALRARSTKPSRIGTSELAGVPWGACRAATPAHASF